jgi:hypothetical protein
MEVFSRSHVGSVFPEPEEGKGKSHRQGVYKRLFLAAPLKMIIRPGRAPE